MKKLLRLLICVVSAIILLPGIVKSQITITPSVFEFPSQQIGTVSENRTFVITNNSNESLTLHPDQIAIAAEEGQSTSLSLLTFNIWFDSEQWPVRFELILDQIREIDPDIIGLQEVIQRASLDNQAKQLADSLGYYYYFDSVDSEGQDQRFGNAILSRYPIEETNFRALVPLDAYRKAVHARVRIDDNIVDVYNTHLHNPGDATQTRIDQINDLHDFIEETSTSDLIFVTGDFNANPDWEEMDLMYEQFRDIYPIFYDNHLEPEHSTLNYHLGHAQRRIDYIFFDKDSESFLTPLSADIVLDEPNENDLYPSDHFGVLAEFEAAWSIGSFGLRNIEEPVELQPNEQTSVGIRFQPQSEGFKQARLIVSGEEVPVSGEAYDATITTLPWTENFNATDELELPFGWSSNAENWYVFNSNYAGGESPELVFWWEPVRDDTLYVRTPPLQTTGLDSMNLSFKHLVDNFEDPGIYNLRLISIIGDDEFTILDWENPDNIPSEQVSVQINRTEHGVGADQLQLAWVFEGSSDNIVRWAIDDIEVGAEPTLVITPKEIEFGLIEHNTSTDPAFITITNIGGGMLEITTEDIEITGENADQFKLTNIDESEILAHGDTTQISVTFNPNEGGVMHAELRILNNAIPLTGAVFDPMSNIERYIDFNLMRGGSDDDSEFNRVPNPAPDDVNSSDEVVEFRRSQHGVPWGGFFSFLPVPLNVSSHPYMYVDVWKPRISPLRFKLEDGPTPDLEIESMVPQTEIEQWETVVFDFSEKSGEWNIIAFMPDFSNPVNLEEDIVIYFSDIRLGDEPDFATNIETKLEFPQEFGIEQNYPNPFNPTTNIHYQVPERADVTLEVFNILGQKVATLVDESLSAGFYQVTFDGSQLASGLYLYRMQAGDFIQTRKLMLVK
jgi:endonuclease/exonuclease/phosphatase family metal-dependent hydrolase